MTITPDENAWPRLLSFAGHELRNSLTVVAGYVRMLLTQRAGPLSDMQRRLLEETDKSCARLSVLLAEMSEVAAMESGKTPLRRSAVDLHAMLSEAIASLPEPTDRVVEIALPTSNGTAIEADAPRLKIAFAALFTSLRRELISSNQLLVREREGEFRGKPAAWIAIGDERHIGTLESATPESLATFDECRGGAGLSLAIARRVIDSHGGGIWSPSQPARPEDRIAGAVVALPRS